MVLLLYSDKKYEYQVISLLKSLEDKITPDVKIVYYNIGFCSLIEFKNLIKISFPLLNYPLFHYYKAELSLYTMKLFPEENHFIFTDTDVLFSKRFNFGDLKHDLPYPLASLGPHEFPFIYEKNGDEIIYFNEKALMSYFNVKERSQRYVWSCFYTFNQSCKDFFEEFTSMCRNDYLLQRRNIYFPFHDETSFNICLWKRNAIQNLGFNFVNTDSFDVVKLIEENLVLDINLGRNFDDLGNDWEYISDSSKIIYYHGFKDETKIQKCLNYLIKNE